MVTWSRKLTPVLLSLPAEGTNAQLLSLDASIMIAPDDKGNYMIDLPAAQPDDTPDRPAGADAAIGGAPFILIERPGTLVDPLLVDLNVEVVASAVTPDPAITRVPGSIFDQLQPTPRPTVNPSQDTTPPITIMQPLPVTSSPTFTVSWSGQDNSGIRAYTVWVRVDGGTWDVWMNETLEMSAEFSGQAGSLYEFDVWAVDLAGNWSDNLELQPRAVTRVEG